MLGCSPQLCCPGCAAGLQRSNMSMADMTDGFVKNTESTFGKPNPSRDTVRAARRVVVKVQLHAALMVLRHWNQNQGQHGGPGPLARKPSLLGEAAAAGPPELQLWAARSWASSPEAPSLLSSAADWRHGGIAAPGRPVGPLSHAPVDPEA